MTHERIGMAGGEYETILREDRDVSGSHSRIGLARTGRSRAADRDAIARI
jgi:hypothetical protein